MRKIWLALPIAAASLTAASAEVPGAVRSGGGQYQVVLEGDFADAPQRQFVSYGINLYDAQDAPVVGAEIAVDGGMPEHGHGLATRPLASEDSPGHYRIDGFKFIMTGRWVVVLDIATPAGSDRVLFEFDL